LEKTQRRVSRLLEIIIALEAGGEWHAANLAERFGVSRTRIFNDIRELREAGVPVRRTRAGYRIDVSFFLPSLRLTPSEVLSLLLPLDLFGVGNGEREVLRTARDKLIACLPDPLQDEARDLVERTSVVMPSTDVDERIRSRVRKAVMERRRIVIAYTDRQSSEPRQLEIHPYGLAFRKSAWYCLAFSPEHGEVRKFRLSRISAVEPTPLRFTVPEGFRVEDCFAGAFYVFSGTPQEIRLRFSPRVARLVRERRPQPGQHIQTLSDGSILYRAQVNNLDEVAWWIVQYGGDACVQQPPELRSRVLALAHGILTRHGLQVPAMPAAQAPRRPYLPPRDQGLGFVAEDDGPRGT
jgi:predicted DNA-binding transcriptional regulator YafY